MEYDNLTLVSRVGYRATCSAVVSASLWLCAMMGAAGCASDDDEAPKRVEPDMECVASEIKASAFTKCTCKGVESDPGPGTFGCVTPRVVYDRVCMIDSSCNAYAMPKDRSDPMKVATIRDDVAFRFEWAETIPDDAHLVVNEPEEGASALLSPFTFFAVENPATYVYDFQEMSDAAEDAELVVAKDRRSVTLIPERRCFSGHWFLQANLDLSLIYGGTICGEPEIIHPGYTAYYFVDD
jgi:hypothetical protein